MCKGPLTHSLHCSEFVELTLFNNVYSFKDFRHPLYLYVNLYLSATSLLAQYLHQYQSYEYVGSPLNRAFQSSG